MAAQDINQAQLIEKTGINKTTVSLLVNDQQDYNPEYVREFARALNVSPYELFLHPDDAFGLRKLMADAEKAGDLRRRLKVVADNTDRTGTDD